MGPLGLEDGRREKSKLEASGVVGGVVAVLVASLDGSAAGAGAGADAGVDAGVTAAAAAVTAGETAVVGTAGKGGTFGAIAPSGNPRNLIPSTSSMQNC